MTAREYIAKYGEIAIESAKGTTLYPSLMLAQAMLESGYGKSTLASLYNNHFGIKAGTSWTGAKVNLQTREVYQGYTVMVGEYFRVYPSVLTSYKDRNKLLLNNSRYVNAGVFRATNPEEQAIALQKAGYATDPAYANSLINQIYQYNLKELDSIAKKKASTGSALLPLSWALPSQALSTFKTIRI